MTALTRLSINMNDETTADLKWIAERHGRSYTETIRRMIQLARFLEDELDEGNRVLIREPETNTVRELVIR